MPERSPLVSFERAVLVCAVLFVGYLLSRYDVCFQDAEVLTGQMFDEGRRLRLFSYLGYVVTRETRLALWSVAPPHPSFTPLWMLTLLAGPMLLFTFLRIELRSRATAMTGVAVYLVSVGYLSGATMLFHAGKPLANVVVIATLLLSAHINSRMQRRPFEDGIAPAPPRLLWFGLLGLLTVAPFVDETAVFAYAIPLSGARPCSGRVAGQAGQVSVTFAIGPCTSSQPA